MIRRLVYKSVRQVSNYLQLSVALRLKWKLASSVFLLFALSLALEIANATAQDVYQLQVADRTKQSFAVIQADRGLMIRDNNGKETFYRRQTDLDTDDQLWIGFHSKIARQAILWPTSNSGSMKIGTPTSNQQWSFRTSQMQIVRVDTTEVADIIPEVSNS